MVLLLQVRLSHYLKYCSFGYARLAGILIHTPENENRQIPDPTPSPKPQAPTPGSWPGGREKTFYLRRHRPVLQVSRRLGQGIYALWEDRGIEGFGFVFRIQTVGSRFRVQGFLDLHILRWFGGPGDCTSPERKLCKQARCHIRSHTGSS